MHRWQLQEAKARLSALVRQSLVDGPQEISVHGEPAVVVISRAEYDRLLGVDAAVADRWGRLLAEAGRPLPAVDSLLAATALHHDLRVVTRNTGDFALPGLETVNPWSG